MNHHYLTVAKLIRRIRKLRKRLHNALPDTRSYQKQLLQKRYEQCLQKLSSLSQPAYKAAAIGVAAFITLSAAAQSPTCDSFRVANRSNPIARIQASYHNCGNPEFVDMDGDGDYDCYESYNNFNGSTNIGQILFMRNTGTKAIPSYVVDTTAGLANITFDLGSFIGSVDGPKFVDIDGDGDYDCVLPYTYIVYGGKLRYFENTGNAQHPSFTERTGAANPFDFVHTTDGLHLAFTDIDNDGDYDMVISAGYSQTFWQNEGKGVPKFPTFKFYTEQRDPSSIPYAFYDWNRDGLQDEFTKGNQYFENVGRAKKPRFDLSPDGPWLQPGVTDIIQFVDINNDGFIDIFDYTGNLLTTAPDAYIVYDSTKSNILHAYPRVAGFTFRWLRNGAIIPGATGSNYTATQPGAYVAQVTSGCGTGVSRPTNVYVITAPSRDEAGNFITQNTLHPIPGTAVNAYPNPFANSFILQLGNNVELSKTTIRITDVQGRVVQTIKPDSYTVHMGSSLSKGVFMIQVMTDKKVVYQQKIMKQ